MPPSRQLPSALQDIINHRARMERLIDSDRAAACLGLPRGVYDRLLERGKDLRQRTLRLVADRLGVVLAPTPLAVPIPHEKADIRHAACLIGLTIALGQSGAFLMKAEYQELAKRFGEEDAVFALKHRRFYENLDVTIQKAGKFRWPLKRQPVETLGLYILMDWARSVSPVLVTLLESATPPDSKESNPDRVPFTLDAATDRLVSLVIDRCWT